MSPGQNKITGSLPELVVRCLLSWSESVGGGLNEVALRLDTVIFNLDTMKLHLVWRAAVNVTDHSCGDVDRLLIVSEPVGGPHASLPELRAKLGV